MNVGIVADGNGRWAERRGLPRTVGHGVGTSSVERVVFYLKGKVTHLVLYGFSTENWNRPEAEVVFLFELMEESVRGRLLQRCLSEGVRLYHFGRRDRLPVSLLQAVDRAVSLTEDCKEMHVGLCLDYGARDEIERAAQKYSGGSFSSYLDTWSFPDVDLIIRTGGEHRLSNFLLYQSAYAELYFTDTLFPDLAGEELERILSWYGSRVRKFGR